MAIAPSPVTLQAVPNESIAIYNAIIRALLSASNPSIDDSGASAAMIAPPGTPGAATMTIPSIVMKCRNVRKSKLISLIRHIVMAQHVIFIAEPDIWIVAHSGTENPATPSDTPFFNVWRIVTGIVAADDDVPSAVK